MTAYSKAPCSNLQTLLSVPDEWHQAQGVVFGALTPWGGKEQCEGQAGGALLSLRSVCFCEDPD